MQFSVKSKRGALAVGAIAAAAIALPSAAQADDPPTVTPYAQPGEVCNILFSPAPVLAAAAPNAPAIYYLFSGDGFRVAGYAGPYFYRGHGNGLPTGYLRRYLINQASCH